MTTPPPPGIGMETLSPARGVIATAIVRRQLACVLGGLVREGMPNAPVFAALLAILSAPAVAAEPAPAKPNVQTQASQAAMTPAAALERLKAGNARFVANTMQTRDWSAKVMATASGQYPFAIILGCMDSRGPVEILFDQGIGDLFVLRVAGNVVNSDELGSLEYALHVGTKLI